MSYLSRIRFNPQRSKARRFLTDPQALHAAVLSGLPVQRVTERVLWRLDGDQPLRPEVLVVTGSEPSWEHLVEQAGWPSADDPDDPQVLVRPYEHLLDRLASGQSFVFRLTANPVVATKRPERLTPGQRARLDEGKQARSRQVAHRTVAQQLGWLLERQDQLGFRVPDARASEAMGEPVPDLRVVARNRLQFSRRGTSGRVTIQTATYEGRMEVRDPDLLRRAMVEGVGRAKAYGCGLLTLAGDTARDD